jgi:hypothetical protein
VRTLKGLYPDRENIQRLSDDARIVVSEPIGDLRGAWNEVPEGSYGMAGPGEEQLRPFRVKHLSPGAVTVWARAPVPRLAGSDSYQNMRTLSPAWRRRAIRPSRVYLAQI